MNNYSQILRKSYNSFMLPLGGKKIPTPYRRNEIGSFQKLDPEFQGKSSPEVLTKTAKKLAKEQKFDLNKASVEEIRNFMRKNKLGIDCSGFAYRMLNYLVQKVKGKLLTGFGLPHVGRTNVRKLTSDEFTIPVKNISHIKPGDLIRLNGHADIPHCMVIIDKSDEEIVYAHSSGQSKPDGVHLGKILLLDPHRKLEDQKWLETFNHMHYSSKKGDGIRRLKFL